MSRDAELVKRETGRHALWLGYPLLYAAAGESDILAPVFLWPVLVVVDYRRQVRVVIRRTETLPPQFNQAMSSWLQRQLDVELPNLPGEDLSAYDIDAIGDALRSIAE